MDVCVCVCVCAFFECLRSSKPKVNGQFHGGRPRSKFEL
jgi:hypothetical protein